MQRHSDRPVAPGVGLTYGVTSYVMDGSGEGSTVRCPRWGPRCYVRRDGMGVLGLCFDDLFAWRTSPTCASGIAAADMSDAAEFRIS